MSGHNLDSTPRHRRDPVHLVDKLREVDRLQYGPGPARPGESRLALAAADEIERLTAALTEAKQQGPGEGDRKGMLIGTLLDHWEGTPNDLKAEVREFGCGKQLDDLLRYMQEEQPLPQVEAKRQTGGGEWTLVTEAHSLPRDSTGVSGPCAVLLPIDITRDGPFIRQARFDVCADSFVCDATGQTLRDAVAFIRPKWPQIAAAAKPSGGLPDA